MNKNIKYSQNFLTSEKVLNQIIKQLNLKETDTVYEIVLGSGEINHSGSGENRQFWSNENHQSGVASPQVVLFTRPAAGQPVSQ